MKLVLGDGKKCFRLLSEFLSINDNKIMKRQEVKLFPSPLGVLIYKFNSSILSVISLTVQFPSPLGVLIYKSD